MTSASLKGSASRIPISKIICVGRNYAEHAKEMKADLPTAPVLFLKPPSAVIHNGGTIVRPDISRELHHEVEITLLIGKGGKAISKTEALSHIAGYGVGLDMTLRDVQSEAKKKGLPWTLAKGFDTSAPLSEFVPAGQIPDPHRLTVELTVNGTKRQRGSATDFIFKLDDLISYISRYFALEPGDVIFTGTPEGVAQVVDGDILEATLGAPGHPNLTGLSVRIGEAG